MSVAVTGRLLRGTNNNAPFAVVWEDDSKLSHVTVPSIAARDAIPEWKRMPEMTCRVVGVGEFVLGLDTTILGQVWTEKPDLSNLDQYVLDTDVFDSEGFIKPSLIKNVYLNESFVVANEAAMIATIAVTGNFFITTNNGKIYVKLNNDNPADIADFVEVTNSATVVSVNGQTGVVEITLAGLLAVGGNLTTFNNSVASSPVVLDNISAIASLTSRVSTLEAYTYVDGHLAGKSIATPGAGQDGLFLQWDNDLDQWVYAPASTGGGGGGTIYNFGNGLSEASGVVSLGGPLNQNTTITGGGIRNLFLGTTASPLGSVEINAAGTIYIENKDGGVVYIASTETGGNVLLEADASGKIDLRNSLADIDTTSGHIRVRSNILDIASYNDAGSGVSITARTGTSYGSTAMELNISTFNTLFTDSRVTPAGIEYAADYSSTFTDRSLVDKAYVDANSATYTADNGITLDTGVFKLGGTLIDHTTFNLEGYSISNFGSIVHSAVVGGVPTDVTQEFTFDYGIRNPDPAILTGPNSEYPFINLSTKVYFSFDSPRYSGLISGYPFYHGEIGDTSLFETDDFNWNYGGTYYRFTSPGRLHWTNTSKFGAFGISTHDGTSSGSLQIVGQIIDYTYGGGSFSLLKDNPVDDPYRFQIDVPVRIANRSDPSTFFASSPSYTPANWVGSLIYDTTEARVKVYDGTAWVSVAGEGGWATSGFTFIPSDVTIQADASPVSLFFQDFYRAGLIIEDPYVSNNYNGTDSYVTIGTGEFQSVRNGVFVYPGIGTTVSAIYFDSAYSNAGSSSGQGNFVFRAGDDLTTGEYASMTLSSHYPHPDTAVLQPFFVLSNDVDVVIRKLAAPAGTTRFITIDEYGVLSTSVGGGGGLTLSSPITGYTAGSNTALADTDTILQAFGLLQGQINAREGTITGGLTSQYWRGDKTWQTLNTTAVTEGTGLYFTEARVRSTVITGYTVGSNSALVATDNLLEALGKIQGQINAREGSITAGTTAQYWRGDKTWQTLNTTAVAEGTGLYFTEARVRSTPLTGFSVGANSAIVATDNILAAFGKVQGQINALSGGSATTINNNANNRLITGSASANTLEAEANLLYDAATGILSIVNPSGFTIAIDGSAILFNRNANITNSFILQGAAGNGFNANGQSLTFVGGDATGNGNGGNVTIGGGAGAGSGVAGRTVIGGREVVLSYSAVASSSTLDEVLVIDSAEGGVRRRRIVSVGTVAPSSPAVGDLWVDTN